MSNLQSAAGFEWKTHAAIGRHPANPVLEAAGVPFHATLIFNAGVCKFQGRYVMIFRNDYGDVNARRLDGCNLGIAFSRDGVAWDVAPEPINDDPAHPLYRAYDPRLTVLDGRVYLCFARGTHVPGHARDHGVCGGIAVTDDFENWEVLSVSAPDNRNMAVFPQRIGGNIVRFERPFAGYLRAGDRFDMWVSESPDGRYWGDSRIALTTEQIGWVNNKIGPAAPPVRTDRGWLTLFHGVDIDASRRGWGWEGNWNKRYSAGIALFDLKDPSRLIGLCPEPILVPEADIGYEACGYRDYVIFPGGMILEDTGEVKIYYGAADTVECLATADVDDLLSMCEPV